MLRLTRDDVRQLLKSRKIPMTEDLAIELEERPEPRTRRIRDDIGVPVRSIWEANYARYLNWLKQQGQIHDWKYEARVFRFPGITRGTTEYRPDFQVWLTPVQYEWVEIKGYLDPRSKTQLKRMRIHFPQERVVVIGKEWFAEAVRSGLSRMLPGWERRAT